MLQEGATLALYPTGETNTPTWMMKGTMYLKSRYLTLRAVNQMPAPKASTSAASMKAGSRAQCHDGILPNQIDAPT